PIVYGSDTVHGHNNVFGATIFPHNIGLGAANDPALMRQIGAATADESAATGVKWGFAPCLCVARNDRWGRTYESYGEVPQIDGQAGFTAAEVSQAINAGIDMVMVPNDFARFISTLRAEVNNGHVPMSRINDANQRILTKKFQLGLFERPLTDRSLQRDFGSAAH